MDKSYELKSPNIQSEGLPLLFMAYIEENQLIEMIEVDHTETQKPDIQRITCNSKIEYSACT